MEVALPLVGGFAVGIAVRDLLRRSFATVFRLNLAVGVALVGLLAGWSFTGRAGDVAALGLLLAAQLSAVLLAARLFRGHRDGPLLAFTPYGNPGFWTVPVAAATLGPRDAVVIAAYDMVTQPRLAVALRLMRRRAPVPQRGRTALADYAPAVAATTGLIAGRIHPAPAVVPHAVAVLATLMAAVGALLIGAAWPRRPWFGRHELALTARALALHLTFAPSVLALGTLAGLDVPRAAWLLALGPLPISTLPFARLYGYSTRLAACTIAVSLAVAVALLPLALEIARSA
jgi:predicted permease